MYLNQKFKPVVKDRLYYDRFVYCIGFHLDEVNCLRLLDHDKIDQFIERRQVWREIAQQRWVNGQQNKSTILAHRWKTITEKTVKDLHGLAEVLLTTKVDFKLVVTVNQGYIYFNDLTFIDQIDQLPQLTHKDYSQAKIDRPKNTIRLKNSSYQYRSYFKITKLSPEKKTALTNFLQNQQQNVRLSPSLVKWISHPFTRTQDYFFIDYNTESWLTMLGLVHPGIIRKTLEIIPAK